MTRHPPHRKDATAEMAFKIETGTDRIVKIKVIGVGGGGNNVVKRMTKDAAQDIDFVAINTDKQALDTTNATLKIQIGEKLTHGQGAGSNPEIGKKSAEESHTQIVKSLENTDMVFITAGMGGGTGTGAAPIVAEIARNEGILTVGVVTKPFGFEGRRRMQQAEKGIDELRDKVDALVIIPNERLKLATKQKITLANAFEIADNVLKDAVQSISDLISATGFINLDFADVTAVMKNAGLAHMGIGRATGKDKAEEAARMAITSPLMETSIHAARGILINITGSMDIGLDEVERAASLVQESVHPAANIIFGAVFDETMQDELRVTVIATGFEEDAPMELPQTVKPTTQGAEEKPAELQNKAAGNERVTPQASVARDKGQAAMSNTASSEIRVPTTKAAGEKRVVIPVPTPTASQVVASHISARAAFDNMINEMQHDLVHSANVSNISPMQPYIATGSVPLSSVSQGSSSGVSAHTIPLQSDAPLGDADVERLRPQMDRTAAGKPFATETSTSDSREKAGGFDDPLEAIRRIFENRGKNVDF